MTAALAAEARASEEPGAGPVLSPSLKVGVASIESGALMRHVRFLADPKLAGREAGLPGARLAANYIAEQFRQVGLRPGGQAGSYFQPFSIYGGRRHKVTSKLVVHTQHGKTLNGARRGKDYSPVLLPGDKANVASELVLAGYGLRVPQLGFSEYRGLSVKGKAVLLFSGTPWSPEAGHWVRRAAGGTRFGTLVYKALTAAKQGASLVLVVNDPAGWRGWVGAPERLRVPDHTEFPQGCPVPVVQVTRAFAAKLSGISLTKLRLLAQQIRQQRRPVSRALPGRRVVYQARTLGRAQVGRNVLGVLVGRDPQLQKEAVVIGAHFDHLGQGPQGTFRGANDNAAGVGAVIEIARACAQLPLPLRPRRSIVFVAFGAEEIGRLGSGFYVRRPAVPIKRTRLMINFDMIGRNGANHVYAVASRSSRELHRVHQLLNRHVGLRLSHPQRYRLGLSDHTFFFEAKVPILYLFGGRHPGYHTPLDVPELLEPEKIARVSRLALLTAWWAANRKDPLSFDGYRER